MSSTTGSGGKRAVVVTVIALLAAVLAYGVHSALSPPRLTDSAATTEALEPPSSAGSGESAPSAPSPPGPRAADPSPQTSPGTRSAAPSATAPAATAPSRVEIPSLGATLPVKPVGVDVEQAMEIPEDPDTAGWYRFGPDPTAGSGASVIAAHTDTAGKVGPLSRLDRLDPGAHIRVSVGDEQLVYVVTRVDHHAKKALDLDALFDRSGTPRLHLVSCGGEWDAATRSYEDNVIAVATRVPDPTAVTYGGSREG